MQPNLIEWLKKYLTHHGPVWDRSWGSACETLCKAKRLAGIPAGKNETRNSLRKSFISYRLAQGADIKDVAKEAGNSPEKIVSNYLTDPEDESTAGKWFSIVPPDPQGVLFPDFVPKLSQPTPTPSKTIENTGALCRFKSC
jgi:hypothetical protein